MKKALVVAALLGVMLVAERLKQSGVSSAGTLTAIGFVVLAAYAVAELGKSLSLPQVTGYILAGVALGPSAGGIISGEVVGEMRMFNTLALGLIATSAGLELDVRQLARLGRTLLYTTLIKVVVGVSLVAGTLLAVESLLGSLGLQTDRELLALALVMGVLSIGTSPSITLAVLSETGAKGRLSDLVLGAAVFKDLVVVVGLAIATAAGHVLLQPDAALDSKVLTNVAFELAGSIGAGGVVGLAFILYVRFIGAEMLLFVAAMILVAAELCRAMHLELLLVFIAAGFVVRNFSKFEHDLMRPLQLVALPVFVVFFANAGSSIDLVTTWKILPLALALCVVRAATYILASRVGGKWSGEPAVIREHAWLAFLPQAGVTLGLVGLASLQLPALATPITNTGMAVVALNLLVGPITLRRALALARELPRLDPAGAAQVPSEPAVHESPTPLSSPQALIATLPESLQSEHAQLARDVAGVLLRFARDRMPRLPALPDVGGKPAELTVLSQLVVSHRAAYQALYADLTSVVGRLPQMVRIAPEPSGQAKRRGGRQWFAPRARELPLRRLARVALGPATARYVVRTFEAGLRGDALHEGHSAAPAAEAPAELVPALPPDLEMGLGELARLMHEAWLGRLSTRKLRYSSVEPGIRRQLQSLMSGSETELARVLQAARGSALLEQRRVDITSTLRGTVQRCVIAPALATLAKVEPALDILSTWLDQSRHDLASAPFSPAVLVRLRADFDKLAHATCAEVAREFRFAATLRATLAQMKADVEAVPGSIECLVLAPGAPLTEGRIQTIPLRSHVDALIRHIMPQLDVAARSVSAALSQVPRRVDDGVQPEWTLLEAQVDLAQPGEIQALAKERLARARRQVERVNDVTSRTLHATLETLTESIDAAFAAFSAEVVPGATAQNSRDGRIERRLTRLRRASLQGMRWARGVFLGAPSIEDAAAVRRALHGGRRPPVPEAVDRWFDLAPVSDERLFAAHRRLLEPILDAESARTEAGYASVLIVGPTGSGKSSLLNMCELELPSVTQVRLRLGDFGNHTTLFEALGTLLECPATDAGLRRHLALRGPTIFVDDLASWIGATRHRQVELQRLLQLIAATRRNAFWLVTVETSMLRLFNELVEVEEVFTHVLRLPALSLREVKHLIDSRLGLLGLEITFQPSAGVRLWDRFRPSREPERFYQAIQRASNGNPGRVVALCRQAFRQRGQTLMLSATAVAGPMPPAYRFSGIQLAILATLHRYGPQALERLARELSVPSPQLQRGVAFLSACGLIDEVDEGHALSISEPAAWMVFQALVDARLTLDVEH